MNKKALSLVEKVVVGGIAILVLFMVANFLGIGFGSISSFFNNFIPDKIDVNSESKDVKIDELSAIRYVISTNFIEYRLNKAWILLSGPNTDINLGIKVSGSNIKKSFSDYYYNREAINLPINEEGITVMVNVDENPLFKLEKQERGYVKILATRIVTERANYIFTIDNKLYRIKKNGDKNKFDEYELVQTQNKDEQKMSLAVKNWRDSILLNKILIKYNKDGLEKSDYFCVINLANENALAVNMNKPVDANKVCLQ